MKALPCCNSKESLFIPYNDPNCQKLASTWAVEGDKSDCCLWYGVECDEATGHVIGLDLSDSCLYGPLNSSSSLFRLVHLQSLNLAFNHFHHSQIPFAVGNLSRLTHLNLSNSYFSGQIPSGVSHLSKLSSLDLSRNYGGLYTGSDLRSFVQNFTSLEELLLSYVNISSVVPESLANLSSLKTLHLGFCGLLGEFPTRLFQLPNLRDLSIGNNWNLSGQLPEFHSNTSLEVLELYTQVFMVNYRLQSET
jgi:Leucine-rich repeat (LRR) protein